MVFINTDNSMVERTFYRGNVSSTKLFDLVDWARLLGTNHTCRIYISHVSGKRMISEGTDGISRGLIGEVVTYVLDMLSFIPFGEDVFVQHPPLEE